MSGQNIKKNVVTGFFWKAMESGGDQLITFLISVVLARLLGPEEYGSMSVMLIFITIAGVIVQNGFQTALIQKKDIDDIDLSSVFWVGLLISAVLYALIFASAGAVAGFFGDPGIKEMLRVLSLILFSGAAVSVETAIVARSMNFRVQCAATVAADAVSGAAGVAAALKGLGTWALVLQQLIKNVSLMVFLYISLRWLPVLSISIKKTGELFSYGWKVLVSGLIDTVYTNLYTPIISKLYDSAMVGFYNRANQFPQVVANSMAQTMQGVMLPAFSRTQGDRDYERKMLRRAVKTSGFLMFPVMFGLMAVSKSFVLFLLGEEWLPAVPLLRLCCLSYSVWHIHAANLQAINANGRSDIYLKLEIIKKAAGVAVLVFSARFGITGMIFMKALFDYVCVFINAAPNARIMDYGPLKQWKDILPEFLMAGAMGAAVYLAGIGLGSMGVREGSFIMLAAQVLLGVVLYGSMAALFRSESLRYVVETVRGFIRGEG